MLTEEKICVQALGNASLLFWIKYNQITKGTRAEAGIGIELQWPSYAVGNKTNFYSRYIYDLSHFVIVHDLLFEVIFGIIVETFAELREKYEEMEENKRNVCFVWSLEREKVKWSKFSLKKQLMGLNTI